MNQQKRFMLVKHLPNCPKGRIFNEDIYGNFYLSRTDDEVIQGIPKYYHFTKEEIQNNPHWFIEIH